MELKLGSGPALGADQLTKVRVIRAIDPIWGKVLPETMEVDVCGSVQVREAARLQHEVILTHKGKQVACQKVQEAVSRGNHTRITCKSDLEFLKTDFMGDMYVNGDSTSLLIDLVDIFRLDMTNIQSAVINGHIPMCNRRQALQMLTFAQGAYVKINPRGEFAIKRLETENPTKIPSGRILSFGDHKFSPSYTRVELVAHSYTKGTQPVQLFKDKEFSTQLQTIFFEEPVWEVKLRQGKVESWGVNYAVFQPLALDTMEVKPYLHNTRYYVTEIENLLQQENSRVLSVRDNGLIHQGNVQTLLDDLASRARNNQQLELEMVVDTESVGDLVTVDAPWGDVFTGYITYMDSTYTKDSHVARIRITGE